MTETPGQTVGPFFHHALAYPGDSELVPFGSAGSVVLHGYVHDGAGDPVPDAMIEIRQADASGVVPAVGGSLRRGGAAFTGWGRSCTDAAGHYWFSTVEPGLPFFAVTVFARGLLDRLFTRIYLPDAPGAMEGLIATREADGRLRFDIHLQGPSETVFLTFPRT
ncbi:dioxygenase family protein [Lentzea flava]|uniref:Protocatechuate 3,4-dioxygenase subunit alpha n=1 Tax=Lentzea flava TaxID=103732 RepID=A0ABQ2UFD3_9PSEU|nr:protocatechuate 3,4-dioxygenase subunit alpha [Lentzea flava]MCP2198038.1 protocatechuate 3,4-dioxygenase alpha subunit [Lentzea flava]GGU24233.1 protocatechuate 3,4-dioxygenase subunit alpha [Lentzea flava]